RGAHHPALVGADRPGAERGGAGPPVRRGAVRGRSPAHPRYAAERGGDGPAHLAGAGHRAHRLAGSTGRRPGQRFRDPSGPVRLAAPARPHPMSRGRLPVPHPLLDSSSGRERRRGAACSPVARGVAVTRVNRGNSSGSCEKAQSTEGKSRRSPAYTEVQLRLRSRGSFRWSPTGLNRTTPTSRRTPPAPLMSNATSHAKNAVFSGFGRLVKKSPN